MFEYQGIIDRNEVIKKWDKILVSQQELRRREVSEFVLDLVAGVNKTQPEPGFQKSIEDPDNDEGLEVGHEVSADTYPESFYMTVFLNRSGKPVALMASTDEGSEQGLDLYTDPSEMQAKYLGDPPSAVRLLSEALDIYKKST